jgi:hypothetical protein
MWAGCGQNRVNDHLPTALPTREWARSRPLGLARMTLGLRTKGPRRKPYGAARAANIGMEPGGPWRARSGAGALLLQKSGAAGLSCRSRLLPAIFIHPFGALASSRGRPGRVRRHHRSPTAAARWIPVAATHSPGVLAASARCEIIGPARTPPGIRRNPAPGRSSPCRPRRRH